jgi:hypothetical protein
MFTCLSLLIVEVGTILCFALLLLLIWTLAICDLKVVGCYLATTVLYQTVHVLVLQLRIGDAHITDHVLWMFARCEIKVCSKS